MKAGVIGCGNLGSSFLKGLLNSGAFEADEIMVSDPDKEKLEEMEKLGVETSTDNTVTVEKPEIIFIAVKPSLVSEVLDELELSEDKLLVSLAAGVSTESLEKHTEARTIRVMPNICGSVSEMASAYTPGEKASKEDQKLVEDVLNKLGVTYQIEEKLMDAVTGLSGSGPAFVFRIIEALKEAGKELDLSEEEAFELAAQTVKGSGELALNSDKNLEELIDIVSSPKGTTIEGLRILEEKKVQKFVKQAVCAAAERSKELSR